MSTASDTALMRAAASGPSGMLIASTPRIFSARASSIVGANSCPLGGISSTMWTNVPRASAWASLDFCSRGSGGTVGSPTATGLTRAAPARGAADAEPTASLIWRMCSGVVPQHPPTRRTPFALNRRAYDAMYSGDDR